MAFGNTAELLGAKPSPISKSEYRNRQEKLYSQLTDKSALIICSSSAKIRSNDVHHPYRTNSDLLYLTGWSEPDSVLLAIKKDGKWNSHLFLQPRNTELEIWEGRRPGVEGALEGWAIDSASSIEEIESVLIKELENTEVVYHSVGFNSIVDSVVEKAINSKTRARQQIGEGPTQRIDPSGLVAELRLIKSDAEIELMRYSAEISSLAHIEAMKNGYAGIGEWQIQGIIEGCFRYLGASNWAYPSIVGCGENATILHYHANNQECKDGDVVLIDAGSEYEGYAADITRSWPVNGKFTESQKKIYNLVLKSQLAAIDACVVGNEYIEIHKAASKVLAEGLVDLGIINCSPEEALENGELKKYFMHGTGHWIGLDVHDVGIYKPDGKPRKFESGMVITIEPGLYFGDWRPDLNDLDPQWAGIGIRIEDDVLITENGPDVLSSRCPKNLDEIESLIGSS
ncbi:MAG: aminopeptidase P N-terminal domain-containing protein [Candidatus Thermoplasmatota archaeon]|nr:aminopeptidase P N-terminal domain-containing protein [Candidatus Thermoplasmatota archaeon]